MARKRANKNLVAFLTVMGILLTVVVVAIATMRGAKKDPEFWAEKAQQEIEAGDLELAIKLYEQAYRVSGGPGGGQKDVTYLAEAAHCAYEYGEVLRALNALERAHAERPADVDVIVSYLEHMWDVFHPENYQRVPPERRSTLLEYAESLGRLDANNVLGAVSEAVARWSLVEDKTEPDSPEWAAGDAAMERALELDATNPRVVLARLAWQRRIGTARLNKARDEGAGAATLQAISDEVEDELQAIRKAGAEANPTNWPMVDRYVRGLQLHEKRDEARAVLEQTVAAAEDQPKPHLGLAALLWDEAIAKVDETDPTVYREELSEVAKHARRAVEIEPALYDAWAYIAQTELLRDRAESERPSPDRYEAALQVFEEAITKTVGLRSLEAALGEQLKRRVMYVRAFNVALAYHNDATDDEGREERWQWVEKFLEAAEVRYPGDAATQYMRGLAATSQQQFTLAAQAFERAEELANADATGRYPGIWMQVFGGVLPMHRLALLYRDLRQPGESLRYTDDAVSQYLRIRPDQAPPLSLMLNRAELLTELQRSQEALDYLGRIRRLYAQSLADDESAQVRVGRAEAIALANLGRGAEVSQVLTDLSGVDGLAMRARHAFSNGDYEGLEARLRELFAREDITAQQARDALRLLDLMNRADRQQAGLEIVANVRKRFGDDVGVRRMLDQCELLLSEMNQDQRDAKLLELIAAETDPALRARRYVSYYRSHGDLEKAAEYLDQLEELLPDDVDVQMQQFSLALRLKKLERAEKYVTALAQQDADHAGGATFRGQLAMAHGRPDEAVREFQTAREPAAALEFASNGPGRGAAGSGPFARSGRGAARSRRSQPA